MVVAGVESNDGMKCLKLKDGDGICNCTLGTQSAIPLLTSLLLVVVCVFENSSVSSRSWISYVFNTID